MSDEPIVRLSPRGADAAAKPKSKGLGRGLGALLGETRREEPLVPSGDDGDRSPRDGFAILPIASIVPDPDQPRRHFAADALDELAASIAQRGVIQPVIVRASEGGKYALVAGERRWRAAQRAHLHEIPALVRTLDDREVMALALIENLQREDLNPIEEARAYQKLSDQEGLTQAEIARMVDKSRSHVANLQRLLVLPESVIALVEGGELSMGHARALIHCDKAEEIAREAVESHLSVRDVEKRVRKQTRGDTVPRQTRRARDPASDADIEAVQRHLEEFLGMPVRISADADPKSGSVIIRYATLDQLDVVCQRLTGGAI